MCSSLAVTGGIAAGEAVTNIIGQNDARQLAKGTENQKRLAVDEQIADNRRRATADYVQQTSDENMKQTQEHQSLAEKENDNTKTQRSATSDAVLAAAEGNVAGNSLEVVKQDYQMQTDFTNGRISSNQEWADYQHTRNDQGYKGEYVNRAMSIQPYQMKVQPPVDYFGPVFKAADSVASSPQGSAALAAMF